MVAGLLLAGMMVMPVVQAAHPLLNGKPPLVALQGDDGGRLDGSRWSSGELVTKVWVVMYVDPDAHTVNSHVEAFLDKAGLPRDQVGSVGIINMQASIMPRFLMDPILAYKQQEYPDAVYVQDHTKRLVKAWRLADDDYNVMVFDRQGVLVFHHAGYMEQPQLDAALAAIRQALKRR